MRTSMMIPAVLVLALGACTVDEPSVSAPAALAPDGPLLVKTAPASRPLRGSCEVAFTPPPMPLPPIVRQVDEGTCELTVLGRTRYYGEQEIDFAAGTQHGWRTFTAANGDVLRATHAGTSRPIGPGLIGFVATLTFAGGTGRFEHATGQARATGTANLITRTTTVTLDGWIQYDASDRGDR